MNNLLKHPIISAVVAGLILSFLMWLSGFLPDIWQWIKSTINTLYSVVSHEITLPLWLVILISVPLFKCLYEKYAKYQNSKSLSKNTELNNTDSTMENSPIRLTDDEQRVMKLLVSADGKPVKPDHIRYHTGFPNLKIEQILETLEEKDLIKIYHNDFNGTNISLTRAGRDLMIGNEYASA